VGAKIMLNINELRELIQVVSIVNRPTSQEKAMELTSSILEQAAEQSFEFIAMKTLGGNIISHR
jgi:hypothetical protein